MKPPSNARNKRTILGNSDSLLTLYEGKRDAFLVKVDDYKSKIETIDNEIAELETQLTARNSVPIQNMMNLSLILPWQIQTTDTTDLVRQKLTKTSSTKTIQ